MKTKTMLMLGLLAVPALAMAAGPVQQSAAKGADVQAKRLTESDRKVEAGRLLLKWGGYVEKVEGQDRKAWAAAMWPSLANADLDNLQKASRAVTYEGMRNALLGQRPYDDQVIDRMSRSMPKAGGAVTKALGSLAADLVFTPITPCRIVDTRVTNDRLGAGATRNLDASNFGGNFTSQGGSNTNCSIPANPAALALSVTGLGNTTTGYLRVFPFNGTSAQGSPVPLNSVNTTVTNDIIVPTSQGAAQELKVFSTANTHYAAFVTGYFMAPQATALECVQVTGTYKSVLAGQYTSLPVASCAVGYTKTGRGITASSNVVVGDVFGGTQYVRSLDTGAQDVAERSICCRVPGR